MTCWRRLRDWQQAGVWGLIHFALLDWLARDDQIDWSRAVVDSCSIRAVYGGDRTGPNPTDRAKRGSKRHLICDGQGRPLAVRMTGANRNDSQEALALVDAIPPLRMRADLLAVAAKEWTGLSRAFLLCGQRSLDHDTRRMPLAVGTRLGDEIRSVLGAGGMGEVYRAHDPKLNRDIALKVLPELFAVDLDRVARFKREAQVLASLNHPHIAAIYGFEEAHGVQALALELIHQ